jgi:hypothetical protein
MASHPDMETNPGDGTVDNPDMSPGRVWEVAEGVRT